MKSKFTVIEKSTAELLELSDQSWDHGLAEMSLEAYERCTVDAGSAEALVKEDSDCIIIAIRGTDLSEFKDILRDINIHKQSLYLNMGRVHAGFRKGALALRGELSVLDDPTDQRPIWLTGHSKGGAEATILAAYLVSCGYNVQGLVTFGCPRVGDSTFAEYVQQNIPYIRRFVNQWDIVPYLYSFWGYTHVTKTIKLSSGGHSMDKYVRNLE